jgi:ABC-2 type transport system ATP-binding protein
MKRIEFDRVTKRFSLRRTHLVKELLPVRGRDRCTASEETAVRDLSFCVADGETLAVLGHNGSGKTTVLRLIAGLLLPTSGVISSTGRIAPLLALGSGFHQDLTGRENVFLSASLLGLKRRDILARLEEIIDFSEIGSKVDVPVRFYSSGMFLRLAFAISVYVDADILLIDEVLAVGDASFQGKCLERMKRLRDEGRTIVLATQSIEQAAAFCQRALVLKMGELTFDGPASDARNAFDASTVGLA